MRRFALISAAAGLALAGGAASSPAAPRLAPPRAAASADAYVTAAARSRNFGQARVLSVAARPSTRAYLRFDLSSIQGATVAKATLRLFAVAPSRRGFTVRSTGSGWSERGITFRNAPSVGARIASSGRVRRGLVTVDITRSVRGISSGGPLNLALTAPGGLARLASRESGSRAPRIDFVLETPQKLVAAGDIAECGIGGDEATAALVENLPGTVAALGDLAYPDGKLDEFNNCYGPSWGRFKTRTRPAPGNHEYEYGGTNGVGYFAYWGAVAGNPAQGWYSYDLGAWHVVSLNSNCDFVGGCQAGSAQEAWLRADLAAHKKKCTLAYWHHPMFSAYVGAREADMMRPFWQALYDANADVVLSGHAHDYQRFAPQNPAGSADSARGIREFVVGTGGNQNFHAIDDPLTPNLQSSISGVWGVLELDLWSKRYDWQFHPVAGQTFTDSGSTACH